VLLNRLFTVVNLPKEVTQPVIKRIATAPRPQERGITINGIC
jgi:hypothetical protein